MANELTPLRNLLDIETVQEKIKNQLGDKMQGFTASMLQIVQNNKLLAKCDPKTILNACLTGAILELPINQNLGFAWVVPYKGKAQFQIGWKGFVQLALRTGHYEKINVIEVYANQFESYDTLSEELVGDFSKEGIGNVVGYCAYLKLNNGFKKVVYWSEAKVKSHAKKYSQAYGKGFSPWDDKDGFVAMGKKTVLKNTISKWGIMSIEMNKAVKLDQSVQNEQDEPEYIDNKTQMIEPVEIVADNEESSRVNAFIEKATTIEDLEMLESFANEEQKAKIEEKKSKIIANGN